MDHRRLLSIDYKKSPVPGLHPGLHDLIRVLGKQAHCASRTLIVCEPVCPKPSYSESKYHKNCGSPKKGRSWDSLCRPSSLWSPIRPESYYYDCFFYRQYPDRESEYQEIEEKYNAIKQEKLDYFPPECDEDRIKAIVTGTPYNKSGGGRLGLGESSKTSTGKGARGGKRGGDLDGWYDPDEEADHLRESAMGSSRKNLQGSGSKRNMAQEDSVPCSELAEIRDLLKKSDRETIRRMQEMLTLMKELSVRDICRATCDGSPPGARTKTGGTRSGRSDEDFYAPEGSKGRLDPDQVSRKRKGDDTSDYSYQDGRKRYKPKGDSKRESLEMDDYGPSESKKIYQQRDEDYEPEGSIRSYDDRHDKKRSQRKDDEYRPDGSIKSYQQKRDGREPKKSLRQDGGSSRKNDEEYADDGYDDDYYDIEHESDPAYQQGKVPKKRKMRPDDGERATTRGSQRRGPSRKGDRKFDDDGSPTASDEEGTLDDYHDDGIDHDGHHRPDIDAEEPRSLQRNANSNRSKGRVDVDEESLSSSSESERSGGGSKGRRKGKKKMGVSDSETDLSATSSTYSASSTTEGSTTDRTTDSDYESSDMESRTPGKAGSSRSLSKKHETASLSSSQASLSVKGSTTSLGKTHSEDRSRKDQKSAKQERGQAGANYTIPVGKKNVPLTVHEVVELSNNITDIIVLEIVDELISRGIYHPPSTIIPEPALTMPRRSVEMEMKSAKGSRQRVNEPRTESKRQPSGHKGFGREDGVKPAHSPSRLSRIDESSSRTGVSKDSRRDRSARDGDVEQGERRRSGDSRRSSCPRHSKSLSPSTSSRRRSSSCRLEIERRARSEGDRAQPRGDVGPSKTRERRASTQMKAEPERGPSRTTVPAGVESPMSSSKITTESLKPPSKQFDRSAERQSSVDRTSSRRGPESGPRTSTQYEAPPRHLSGRPESRGSSITSKISKTGSYRTPSARTPQASLKDGSSSSRQPAHPGSKPNVRDASPRSSDQNLATPRGRSDLSSSRRPSLNSKISGTGSFRSQPDPHFRHGSSPGRSAPGICRTSMTSQTSKRSDGYHPGPRSSDQRGMKDSSLSRERIGAGAGSGKVPSGQRITKEGSKSQGILKDGSFRESSQVKPQIQDRIGPEQEASDSRREASGQRIATVRPPSDKNIGSQRMADSIQPGTSEKEMSKGRLVTISTKEAVPPPDSERRFQQPAACQPCEPDEFMVTDYDTDNSVLYYARISNKAFPPVKETYHAAGFMLRSAYDYKIPPRSKMSVKTDLLIQLPRNSYGRIAPRKCLVENYGIDVGADVIDRDYRGNITVVLFNHGDRPFTVERGNKIAQLICESIHLAKVVENSSLLK